jgi:uncharacterized protein YuzE
MANKKISELPLIQRVSGSVGYLAGDLKSVIPIVVAGTTTQMIVEDFSKFVNAYNAHTGSAGNTFKGPQIIQSTLSVTGNASVGGNLVVAGKLTAEEFYTEITSASVIYSSGSTKFGDDTGDKHEITGSTDISGSFIINGVNLTNFSASNSTLFTNFSSSNSTVFTNYSASNSTVFTNYSASNSTVFTNFSSSNSTVFTNYSASNSTVFTNFSSSNSTVFTNFSSSNATYITALSSSVNGTIGRITTEIGNIEGYTASLKAAAIVSSSTQIQNYDLFAINSVMYIATGSMKGEIAGIEAYTASLKSVSVISGSSQLPEIGGIEEYTASLKSQAIVSSSTQIQNYDIFALNSNLYNGTGSIKGEISGIEAYTSSLKAAAIVSSSTQIQNYDLFALNSNLYTSTGSIKGEIAGIEAYTASLKTAAIVSSSTQVQNYDLFALNSNLYTSTGSIKGEIAGIEAYTSSLKAAISVSGTNVQIIGDLNVNKLNVQYISSSVLVTSGSNIFGDQSTDTHEFTGSVYLQNSLILGTEVLGNAGLNAISASTRIELNSIEEYTASLKTAAIVSSSTQVQNYDVFGLNSNLYNSTGSLIGITNGLMALTASIKNSTIVSSSNQLGEIAGLQAYTSSLKSVAIVSSSQQIQNYNLFAVTSSANTFYGTQTISGSLLASGSSHTIQNGYVILQQVSQSLNFVDDTAAAAGGVPLGGLYRNGNFIVIRIV